MVHGLEGARIDVAVGGEIALRDPEPGLKRRCFVATPAKLILPAFGSLTGGLDAHHPEILRKVGPRASALVPVTGRLLRFPIAA